MTEQERTEHLAGEAELVHREWDPKTAVIVVDHGSRRAVANDQLQEMVRQFRPCLPGCVVEPAHMELVEPSIAEAVDRCVAQGARQIVVFPYFLGPGRHWHEDIPALVSQAVARHAGVAYLVTAPLGLHPLIFQIIQGRITHCLAHDRGEAAECDICQGTGACHFRVPPTHWDLGNSPVV